MKKQIATSIIASLLLCACHKEAAPLEKTQSSNYIQISAETSQSIGLKVESAKVQSENFKISVNGIVKSDPNKTFSISSPVAGKIINVLVNANDVVSQNQLLAQVISQDVAQLEFDLMGNEIELKGQIEQAELELSLANSDYQRESKLFRQGISAQKDLLEAENKYKRAQKSLSVLREKKKLTGELAQKKLGIVGANGGQKSGTVAIKSPRLGIILKRSTNPGELIDTNDVLFELSDLSEVLLEGQIYQKDLPAVSLGEAISFASDACPKEAFSCSTGNSFYGHISYIAPTVDPETRTVTVRARMQNPKFVLKPEMFGKMFIDVGKTETLVVPKEALQELDGSEVVYVQTAQGFKEVPVKSGYKSDTVVQIVSGLKPGEKVATKGSFWIKSELHGEQQ